MHLHAWLPGATLIIPAPLLTHHPMPPPFPSPFHTYTCTCPPGTPHKPAQPTPALSQPSLPAPRERQFHCSQVAPQHLHRAAREAACSYGGLHRHAVRPPLTEHGQTSSASAANNRANPAGERTPVILNPVWGERMTVTLLLKCFSLTPPTNQVRGFNQHMNSK